MNVISGAGIRRNQNLRIRVPHRPGPVMTTKYMTEPDIHVSAGRSAPMSGPRTSNPMARAGQVAAIGRT
jgi:hypothetical protein